MLEPVLVRGLWGRVGSTLLMQLLGTSPDVSFDRAYPFENRCLGNLLHYLAPLQGQPASPAGWWMDDPDRLWWVDPASFGFEVRGLPLAYDHLGVDRSTLHQLAVRGAWQAYTSAVVRSGESSPRYYAEKYAGYAEVLTRAGVPMRMINLVRDPRDVWASVLAFDAKRGFYGFGRRDDQPHDAYRASFVRAVRRRLDEMILPSPDNPLITVRYEDLVTDLPGEAERLGAWLGLELDPSVVEANLPSLRHHMTASTAVESIGRWRHDLSPDDCDLLERELGSHLDRLGYQRTSEPSSSASPVEYR
jgi:hypothetical protein